MDKTCKTCKKQKNMSQIVWESCCVHCMKAQATEGKFPFYEEKEDRKHENRRV